MSSSILGYTWEESSLDSDLFTHYKSQGKSNLVARMLSIWGVPTFDATLFLQPKLLDLLPGAGMFLDIDVAMERIYRAYLGQEKVLVWGDYDVDGACSTALMVRALRLLGMSPLYYVPDRVHEGYGPNADGFRKMAADGVTLCIVVDAGTTAFEPLRVAKSVGVDVVVIDHHGADEVLPEAVAVVNPNRRDQPAGSPGYLCAAAVVFCFLRIFWTFLRDKGVDVPVVPVSEWKALAGLATVTDVVPMRGLNRVLATDARRSLVAGRCVPGMLALAEVAGLDPHTQDTGFLFGFGMGPRINAGGRIGDALMGARLLLSEDMNEARLLAQSLDEVNAERRNIESAAAAEAMEKLRVSTDAPVTIVADPSWHEGIVGIIAGRLKEQRRAPAIVFGGGHNGVLKGSARSVPGFDIGGLARIAVERGIALTGGGHAMAGGLSIAPERLGDLQSLMSDAFLATGLPLSAPLQWDLDIPVERVSVAMVEAILQLQPFGPQAEEPMVMVRDVYAVSHKLLGSTPGKRIYKIDYSNRPGGIVLFSAIIFRAEAHPLLVDDSWLKYRHDVLGRLSLNTWRGNSTVQLVIQDVRVVGDDA